MPQSPLGAATLLNPSNQVDLGRMDAQRAAWTSARHGRNYAAASAGVVGMAANPSGVTTSAALATTYVGLCLSNPAGSAVNLSLLSVLGSLIVAPSTITAFNLIGGYAAGGITVHTTPLTTRNAILGTGPALVGLVDSACTLVGTPAFIRPLAQCPIATSSPFFNDSVDGGIIIPPGAYVAIGTTIAGPASGFQGGFVWEEVPA